MKINVEVPSVTFDRQSWIKAFKIAAVKSLITFVHLGGFHTLINLVDSIGILMEGLGIEKSMEAIYVKDSVSYILSGNALARVLRAHFIIDSALTSIPLE